MRYRRLIRISRSRWQWISMSDPYLMKENTRMINRLKRLFSRGKTEEKSMTEEDKQQTSAWQSGGEQVPAASSRETPESIPERDTEPRAERGMITRTCKKCGKTFTLPEEVQHWPDYCQECRRKYHIVEQITRTCRGCGKEFTFPSNVWHWPNYCRECQAKRKSLKRN